MGIILKTWGHFGQCWEISEAMKLKISLESSNKFCGCVAPRSWLSLNIRYIPQKSLIIPMISSGYHELCWWSHLSLLPSGKACSSAFCWGPNPTWVFISSILSYCQCGNSCGAWAVAVGLPVWVSGCFSLQNLRSWKKHSWLVVYLPLWKIWKSDWIIIPSIGENKACSKPPTR